jgi:hypothetical protein
MAALSMDLEMEQGSTFVLDFQVFDDQLDPLAVITPYIATDGSTQYESTNYSARMKIKRSKYRDPVLYYNGTTMNYIVQPGATAGFVSDGIFFVGGTTGSMRIVITADTTATFKSGRYFYDLELVKTVDDGEVVSKLLEGKFEVEAEATT